MIRLIGCTNILRDPKTTVVPDLVKAGQSPKLGSFLSMDLTIKLFTDIIVAVS
jgi:hypothetical protein